MTAVGDATQRITALRVAYRQTAHAEQYRAASWRRHWFLPVPEPTSTELAHELADEIERSVDLINDPTQKSYAHAIRRAVPLA